jgi:uncharacterized protein
MILNKLATIDSFLEIKDIAMVGISEKPNKFGNSLFKELKSRSFLVYPIHKTLTQFEGISCYSSVNQLPESVKAIVICTKPEKSLELLPEIKSKGISKVWLQQGAENKKVIDKATELGLDFVSKECLMMYLEPVKGAHSFHRWLKKVFGKYHR